MVGAILAAVVGRYPPTPTEGGSSSSVFWPLLFALLVVLGCVYLFRRLHREGKEGPDEGWNWKGWNVPKDWPKLPKAPRGGAISDYVPDEWVWEQLGQPPRLLFPKVPGKTFKEAE